MIASHKITKADIDKLSQKQLSQLGFTINTNIEHKIELDPSKSPNN